MNKETIYLKRLTPSEIKYYYLKIEKAKCDLCPKPGECIIVNGTKLKMHSKQEGRIDGLAKIYKNKDAKIGDVVTVTFISKNEISITFRGGKDVFELENEEFCEQTTLQDTLEKIREKCKTKTYLFDNNETNVRIELIEPILKILGWHLPNLLREAKCKDSKRKADFALFKESKCVLIIEAKSIDKALNQKAFDHKEIQLNNYLTDPRFKNAKYGILTNGQVWQIRNKSGKTIIKSIDILADGQEEDIEKEINEFFNIFKADSFNGKEEIEPETRHHYTANDRTSHFKIIINDEVIKGEDPTATFTLFLEKYHEEIKKLQDENRFAVKIISEKAGELRNDKEASNTLNGKKYYTTGDHSTYLKRMIIQQIIDELGLEARIETID